MNWNYAFATLILLVGHDFASSQQIPSTTTAAELWNPWTWFWPYAIASAEGFRDYYQKAQKATNELYQQAYKTNAFPWITGSLGGNPTESGQGGSGTQSGNQTSQGTGGQPNQNTGGQTNQNTGGQTNEGAGGQTNGATEGQTNQENGAQKDNAQTEEPAQESQTEKTDTGAQVQGNVNGDGTGNAEVSGTA